MIIWNGNAYCYLNCVINGLKYLCMVETLSNMSTTTNIGASFTKGEDNSRFHYTTCSSPF